LPEPSRHFPPPWSVEEPDPKLDRRCFIVRDGNGQALAYVYFEGELGRRAAAHLLTRTKPGASPPISPSCRVCCAANRVFPVRSGANPVSPVSVYLAMKTPDEHSDNKWSEDRRIVEWLQNAVSETRQAIVQTQAVIHEAGI
jgi:hypothetical protein